jgi:two-component system, chemotaxis family, response regulator PixH
LERTILKTVLVVEDGLTDTMTIGKYLQQAGFFVVCVKSGEEAQEKLTQQKPDLILLDVILPGQSGFELCREIKTDPRTSQIPVVICSTKNTGVDKMWGSMLGADAYLGKPVERSELVGVVRQFTNN